MARGEYQLRQYQTGECRVVYTGDWTCSCWLGFRDIAEIQSIEDVTLDNNMDDDRHETDYTVLDWSDHRAQCIEQL